MKRMTQRTALDMIMADEGHGGLSPSAVLLHQKQCEDFEKMEKRMSDIEHKVDKLDKKIDTLDRKFDELTQLVAIKSSFKANLKEVVSSKIFIYLLIIVTGLLAGVPVAELGTFLFK